MNNMNQLANRGSAFGPIPYFGRRLALTLLFLLVLVARVLFSEEDNATLLKGIYPAASSVNVITGEYCEARTDLILDGPRPLAIKRCFFSMESGFACDGLAWHFNHPNVLSPIITALGDIPPPQVKLSYVNDPLDRLSQIKIGDISGEQQFHECRFTYEEDDDNSFLCKVEADDGRSIAYRYSDAPVSRESPALKIDTFIDVGGHETHYSYRQHPLERKMLISKCLFPEGGWIETEYYEGKHNNVGGTLVTIDDPVRDPRLGRIKLQKAPVGPGNSALITQKLFYHKGCTEVVRANGQKTLYRYSDDHHLTAIETYLEDEGGEQLPYKSERFTWSREKEGEPRRLISRLLEDAAGRIISCRTYDYDDKGNMIKESLYGNISGSCTAPIILGSNGLPEDFCLESSSTLYEYWQKDETSPSLLIKKKEPSGKTTRYLYDCETGKNRGELICDGEQIRIRQFYFFNEQGLLVQTITDDGSSEEWSNLEGVSERHIVRLTLRQELPAVGMPEIIEEACLDLASGCERPIRTTHNSYSKYNKVIKQEIFDCNGDYVWTRQQDFDLHGRCIYRESERGRFNYCEYDSAGNKLWEKEVEEGAIIKEFQHTYDLAKRLIRTVEIDESGSERVMTYRYDAMSNKIASSDEYGNETCYEYDSIGRMTKIIYPAIYGLDGESINPTVANKYDISGNVISTTDPNGYETRTKYNVNGDPILIAHPDGTEERFEYYLDGSLKKQTAKNGLITFYKRDFLSRIISKEVLSPSGKSLSTTTSDYNAFHKISETDVNGATAYYLYDSQGRHIATTTAMDDGIHRKEIEYDSQGKVRCEKEWFGENEDDYIAIITERDPAGHPVEKRIESASGKVLRKKIENKERSLNPRGIPQQTLEHYNNQGQKTKKESLTDSNGITTTAIMDALGRVEKIIKQDPLGKTLEEVAMAYDPAGNKVREIHTLFRGSGESSTFTIAWHYGPGNRLETMIEGQGSRLQRTTHYRYNAQGEAEAIIKPDGIELLQLHNEQGQVSRLTSSDGSVDIEYFYDANGNIIEAVDRIQNAITRRQYNSSNRLVSEIQSCGAALTYQYDKCGRKTSLMLPDGSSVAYSYDAVNLVKIERFNSKHQFTYSHKYSSYDLEGHLLECKLINNLGNLHYSYDERGLCTSIASPYWSEETAWSDEGSSKAAPMEVAAIDPLGKYSISYRYDANNQISLECGGIEREYRYDSLGNREGNESKTNSINELNELLYDGSSLYSYDPNGNMIRKIEGETVTLFHYDALNRLTEALVGSHLRIIYGYDPFNRRISKKVLSLTDKDPSYEESYFYDGERELGTLDSYGEIASMRILGEGVGADIGAAVAIESKGRLYAPIHDRTGSIRCLVDAENGAIVEFYRFSAFGEEDAYDGEALHLEKDKLINPWRFLSKRHDHEIGLIFFGKRYYSPAIGRWTTVDPIGFGDGPNRYLFVHNNPLVNFDHYGHFSWNAFWGGIVDAISACFKWISDMGSNFFGAIRTDAHYLQQIQPNMTEIFEKYLGKGFLTFNGYYSHPMESGVYGQGEVCDKVRLTYINGIANVRSYYRDSLELLNSSHGGVNIHYIFRPTDGWCGDMIKALLIKFGYVSPYARELAATWKKLIEEMGGVSGGGMIVHYCHSLGGSDTSSAASLLTPEEKKMIKVFSIGSSTMISNNLGFAQVINYVSVRDGVCLADPIGYFKGIIDKKSNVCFIGSFLGIPLIDHSIATDTYTEIVTNLGRQFLEMYAYAGGFF